MYQSVFMKVFSHGKTFITYATFKVFVCHFIFSNNFYLAFSILFLDSKSNNLATEINIKLILLLL